MLHLSCVVHGLIYGRLMGCTVNGFSLYITLYKEKNRSNFECYTTMPMSSRCSYFELGLPVAESVKEENRSKN